MFFFFQANTQELKLDWYSQYPTKHSQRFNKIISDDEDNIYVCGTSHHPAFVGGFLTFKYTNDGTYLWDAKFDHFFPDLIKDCGLISTGMVVGGSVSDAWASGLNWTKLISYNENGYEIWNEYIYDTETVHSSIFGMEFSEQDDIYVFGFYRHMPTMDDNAMYVNSIDPLTGQTLWSNTFYDSTAVDHTALDGKLLEDRLVVLATNYKNGQRYYHLRHLNFEGEEIYTYAYAWSGGEPNFKFDGEGNLIYANTQICKLNLFGGLDWCYDYYEGETDVIGEANNISIDNEGNIFVIGWIKDTLQDTISYTKTMVFSSEGELLWSNKDIIEPGFGGSVIYTDKYVFVGSNYIEDSNSFGHFRAILYDRINGSFLSDMIIEINDKEQVTDVYTDGEDFYLVGHSIILPNDGNISLLKFSVDETVSTSTQAIANAIKLYPNPTSDILYIEQDKEQFFSSIRIYDSTGKSMLTQSLSVGYEAIDLSALPRGVYIAQLKGNGQILNKRIAIAR